MKEPWATLVTQGCLITLALFIVGSLSYFRSTPKFPSQSLEMYFLSIADFQCRSADERSLVNQMAIAANKYGVKFVVISPQVHNFDLDNCRDYASLRVPWYVSSSHFLKQAMLPSGHHMDIIFLDTISLATGEGHQQADWLKQVLANSSANWRIVVGHHALASDADYGCSLGKLLLPMFVEHGVHVYLHGQSYTGYHTKDQTMVSISNRIQECHHQNQATCMEKPSGFILTRVTPLEMEFMFIDTRGKILDREFVTQGGRAAF